MANSKSAIKRIKINKRNRLRNRIYKSSIKTIQKKVITLSASGADASILKLNLSLFYSLIDKAVKRGIFHKKTAEVKKVSQLRPSIVLK